MSDKYRIHILGLPHTETTKEFLGCAFTQKVWKFLKMFSGRGHQLFHYGHTNTDWSYPDVEHIAVVTEKDHFLSYGAEYTDDKLWKEKGFGHYYRVDDHAHRTFHANAIKEIEKRKQPNDIVLCFWGWGVKPVADAHSDLIIIEPGIGNGSAFAPWRVFESHSVRSAVGGMDGVNYCNQNNYHIVIPNYFDRDDFVFNNSKDSYILYLGRIGTNKGVEVAIQATERAGRRLIIAGQGSLKDAGYDHIPDHVTVYGYADAEARKMLMSKASGLFIASKYGEPFAGVQVEAWLSGTPVISPDYAAFAELNKHGVTGYRCRTFADYVEAVKNINGLNPKDCRRHGEQFLLERIAPEYERYFRDVMNVYTGAGWYEIS